MLTRAGKPLELFGHLFRIGNGLNHVAVSAYNVQSDGVLAVNTGVLSAVFEGSSNRRDVA